MVTASGHTNPQRLNKKEEKSINEQRRKVIQRHFDGIKVTKNAMSHNSADNGDNGIYKYSENNISQQINYNAIIDTNVWPHSSMGLNHRKASKYNN